MQQSYYKRKLYTYFRTSQLPTVQVSDTRDGDSSNADGKKNLKTDVEIKQQFPAHRG